MIPHILLLAATLSPAYASPLTPLSLTPIANLSSPYVGGGGDHEYYCTRLPQWTQPAAKQEDCEGALELFHYETMFDGGTRTSEFITPDARPRRHIRVEVTPRKYIYATCTLAIIMIDDFPIPSALPGGFKTGPPTDSSTYANLNRLAGSLVKACVIDDGEAGWMVTGRENGIGLFFWSTNSYMDRETGGNPGPVPLPVLETSVNGSVVAIS